VPPNVIVFVPAELCQQVLAVVRGLARGAPLRSAALTGGRPWRTQREALDQVSCGSVRIPEFAFDQSVIHAEESGCAGIKVR
jgi:superfamily II DNA/RNA helicase